MECFLNLLQRRQKTEATEAAAETKAEEAADAKAEEAARAAGE